jgi:ferredoxin
MAESRTLTGGRDDLVLDLSRCLRMRFCDSACRRCVDACPHGAVTLDDGLAVNPELCRGCLHCSAVCPAGALEGNDDFYEILAVLSRLPEPVLGCLRTKEHSNASLTCLGGLSEEHLLALCNELTGQLILNMTMCPDCPNGRTVLELKKRLETISQAGLLCGGCSIVRAETAREIHHRDESLDRRGFFKSFGTALFKSADIIISSAHGSSEMRTEYAVKRLPIRRELLNKVRDAAPDELKRCIGIRFDSTVTFDEKCTACQGCVAICPTGALKAEGPDVTPAFDILLCSGCRLCAEFCLDGALNVFVEVSGSGMAGN